MRAEASPYEARCPRCNVSFPPETRKCIHCGGKTAKPGRVVIEEWVANDSAVTTVESSQSPSPIEPEASTFFPMDASEAGEAESESTLPRTLLRSFGTLIWIALLIAFTLARDCGGE